MPKRVVFECTDPQRFQDETIDCMAIDCRCHS